MKTSSTNFETNIEIPEHIKLHLIELAKKDGIILPVCNKPTFDDSHFTSYNIDGYIMIMFWYNDEHNSTKAVKFKLNN